MNKQSVVVIGSGGHAGVAIGILQWEANVEILGMLDDFAEPGTKRHGYRVIGNIADFSKFNALGFVAIGHNCERERIAKIIGPEPLINAIHYASTQNAHVIGVNVLLAAGARVGNGCIVGDGAIINTNASLDHDCRLGAFSHLAPGAVVGGCTTIGNNTMIGLGAMIRDHITIGDNCIVGMGSVVLKNVPDHAVVWGNPARLVKWN